MKGGTIEVYNPQGTLVASTYASELYLVPGYYYAVYKQHNTGYGEKFVNKVYGGTNCPDNCNPLSGSPIYVPDQGSINVSMNLDAYFKISGTLTLQDYNSYAGNITLKIYRNNQQTDSRNFYSSYSFYLAGSEPVKIAAEKVNFYRQLFNNINCQGSDCGLGQATAIQPALNTERVIDFNLLPLNSISGQVFDEDGQPLNYFTVTLTRNGTYRQTKTDTSGRYTFNALNAGDYNVSTTPQSNYMATRHTGETCPTDCAYDSQAAITVGNSGHINGLNINPVKKGGIQVNNLRYQDGRAASYVRVHIYNSDNNVKLTYKNTNSQGNTDIMYLPPGSYFIIAGPPSNNSSLPETVYPGSNCRNLSITDCAQLATTITLTDATTINIDDFIINNAGYLTVTLRDAANQSIIDETREFAVYDTGMNLFSDQPLGPDSQMQLPPGEFYLMAKPNKLSHYSAQLYPNILCPRGIGFDCVVSQGQTINISDNQETNASFELQKKPTLTVTAVDNLSDQPVKSEIYIYKISGSSHIYTSYKTNHTIPLDPGQYYIWAKPERYNNYHSTIYPNEICESNYFNDCNYLNAQKIEMTTSNHTPLTVGLKLHKGIQGQIINGLTQLPVENATIDFWTTYGSHEYATNTNENGYFSAPVSGQLYLSTDIPQNLAVYNEVYNNRHCFDGSAYWNLCDITQGEIIHVNSDEPLINDILIILDDDFIFDDSFESITP